MTATLTRPVRGAVIPAGYRPAMHPTLWVAAVSEAADSEHRSDAVTHPTDLAWVLVAQTDWTTRTVACGWTNSPATPPISRRILARSLTWLRREHLLAVLSTGIRGSGHVNDPAVYVLLEPAPRL